MEQIAIGQVVTAPYKSGLYIGELLSVRDDKAKIRVIAVLRHPAQGDLHQRRDAEVAMFHQRRALADREVANVLLQQVRSYEQVIPTYRDSLQAALQSQMDQLRDKDDEWSIRSRELLEQLWQEYGL